MILICLGFYLAGAAVTALAMGLFGYDPAKNDDVMTFCDVLFWPVTWVVVLMIGAYELGVKTREGK